LTSLRTEGPALTLVDSHTPDDPRQVDLASSLDLATIYLNPGVVQQNDITAITLGGTVKANQGGHGFEQSVSSQNVNLTNQAEAKILTTDDNLLDGFTFELFNDGINLDSSVNVVKGKIEVRETVDFDAIKLADPSIYQSNLTIDDALLTLRHIVNLDTLTDKAYHAADIDNNDKINIDDALGILRDIVNLEKIDTFDLIDGEGNRVTNLEDSNPIDLPEWTLIANGDVDHSDASAFNESNIIVQVGINDGAISGADDIV